MIEVLTEFSLTYPLAQRNVGRTNDPRIGLQHPFGTEPLEFAILEHTQNLYLRERTHVRDFVKKNCAGVREFKFSFDRLLRPSERAFFVTKELTFEQRIAHRRSIERNERALGTRGRIVNGLGKQGFSGAGFAKQNDRDI